MLKLFRNLRKKDWPFVGISLIFIVCQVWLDLKLPDYMSEITKLVQTESRAMNDILYAGGMMLTMTMLVLPRAAVSAKRINEAGYRGKD